MKKFNLKEALFAGTGFTVLYIIIRLWSSDDYSVNTIARMVITGLIGGLGFGFIMGYFLRPKSNDTKKID